MALSHSTKVFGVNDAAVFKLTSDPAGSAPGYAAKVDVPGAKSLELTLETDLKELRGDNAFLAADAVLRRITGKMTHAKMAFDVWGQLTTVTATDTGTTPSQKVTLTLAQTDLPANFKLEGQSRQVDYVGGDVHILVYKCIPGNLLAGFSEEDYREQSFDVTAMPLLGTITGGPAGAWLSIIANETAIAIT
jgi:hypothetical protein